MHMKGVGRLFTLPPTCVRFTARSQMMLSLTAKSCSTMRSVFGRNRGIGTCLPFQYMDSMIRSRMAFSMSVTGLTPPRTVGPE